MNGNTWYKTYKGISTVYGTLKQLLAWYSCTKSTGTEIYRITDRFEK